MRIVETQTFQPILEALAKSNTKPFLVGPNGASLAFTISLLVHNISQTNSSKFQLLPRTHLPQSWVILTPNHDEAEQIYQDLLFFYALLGLPTETVAFFPDRGTAPYEATTPSVDLVAQRMRTLFRLHDQQPTVVITTPRAALQRLVPRTTFANSCLSLKIGSVIGRETLITHLLRIGYRRVSVVEIPGEFSVRGGIVDIFSTAESEPYRIELLGDTVESARRFDPNSQESTENVINARIFPAREYLIPLNQTDLDLSTLTPDAEWQSPTLYKTMNTLLEYFTEQPLILMDRPLNLAHEAKKFWEELLQTWEQLEQSTGISYPEPDAHFLIWEEFQAQMASSPIVGTDVVPPTAEDWVQFIPLSFQSPKSIGLGLRGISFTETLKILEQQRTQGPVTIVVRSASQVGRLLALFAEHQAPAIEGKPSLHSISVDREPFYIQQGYLSSGFLIQDSSFTVVTEDDLFAKVTRHRPQPKSKAAVFLSSLEDLNAGDFVVHVHHGISRYRGLRHLSVQGFESDYLILEFSGKDTLYVPLDRINQIQKYCGGEHATPKLDRLGGTSWAKTKARVKKGIEDMTNELVELYASREVTTRRSYSEDTTLAHEFEASFDYEETPGQIKAIEDIERDLELSKPMDRLVCGDVGYGKTEVAMRAAFKAVQDNRQVAVLVPTTLLAQQHHETFCRRFAPFPVRIGILSRFQSPKEVKTLLPDLASGVVDIVIGTHRVLQKNVQFKNLGLVIIDEEQWFGVRHKEHMKQLRTQIDVLTLTATPIPRTLQMAFSGVRDLSVIETPPPGRLAIRTQVLRFNASVIREAIRRELARGGQIFYVHNRVQSMERSASWLQELVPEARILMAHGQMNGNVLEGVMLKFFHGEADILVASAIIQSGLDIPRANTILVDRADILGLAQLYQLRGRVGRVGDQAYAYFFFPNEEVLTTNAQKRLMAIQEFAQLGSGFRIAAADLEIRGAGNLLGKQQSGNMAAVGLDLYMQMVEQAVQQMKGEEMEEEIDPTLHLNVSAFIPDDYVEDAQQRLSLYKRLSASQKIGDLALLHEETQDRYGSLPNAVERLFEVMQIRLLAKKLRLESLGASKGKIVLTLDSRARIPQESFDWLMQYTKGNLKFLSPLSTAIDTEQEEWDGLVEELNTILQGLLNASEDAVQV
ncbi:MAG: transcription-repair coupling factor [Nitrospirota bacterium]|nr:transcription-repair coupling factor [Nitrospirota bacterium]